MPGKPTRPRQALIVLDMISEFEFPGWQRVLRDARRITPAIVRLRERARRAGVPVIYVNDTGKDWESDQKEFVQRCLSGRARGRDIADALSPSAEDYFIFKPKHSAFYSTPLATLLEMKAIGELILTGISSHQCVLFTAMDAHVRDFRLIVPVDSIGAASPDQTHNALIVLRDAVRARTPRSSATRLQRNSGPVSQ